MQFDRTIGLLGSENFDKLNRANVLVIGVGGVGGTAFESLVRSGVNSFIIIDKDSVDETNLNRQILFTKKDVGERKVEIAKQRAQSINSNVKVITVDASFSKDLFSYLDSFKIDFIIDAIDDVDAKIDLFEYALTRNIGFIGSMGMGNRLDPSSIKIMKLNKTTNDPLAKKIRYECKQRNLDVSSINVVCSTAEPIIKTAKIQSLMTVPSTAGLIISYFAMNYLINKIE